MARPPRTSGGSGPATGDLAPSAPPEGGGVPELAPRLRLILSACSVMLGLLIVGLAYHQLLRSDDLRAREQRQAARVVAVPGPRGVIFDRHHRLLAGNRTTTAAVINVGRLRPEIERELLRSHPDDHAVAADALSRARLTVVQRHLDRVNRIARRHGQITAEIISRHLVRDRLTPLTLADDLTPEESARLLAGLAPDDPIRIEHRQQRWYPHGALAAHALGRVRWELKPAARGPNPESVRIPPHLTMAGVTGIELLHESTLAGQPGTTRVVVDAWGFPIDSAQELSAPMAGRDIELSLDLDLQLAAERVMAATPGVVRGAAVAISVKTGEVLVLASIPSYDLNLVSPVLPAATKTEIDRAGGWFNRATQGLYPPGSTFKLFTMMAGLRTGTLRPDTTLRCEGSLAVGDHHFPCHQAAGHGALTLAAALAHSCNVFAYQTGLAAGADALAAEARRFHFHEATGIDIPNETRRMLVPDPKWKAQAQRGGWTPGDTVNFAIGQGFLRCSPLQMATAIASLARRETLTVPTLVHQPDRRPTGDRPPEKLGLSDGDYQALITGMRAVVETGIGRDAQVPGVRIAGKTGTAQATRPEGTYNIAWFVAFAPVENPEIAIAVAMEGDRPDEEFAGARYSAPIVREILAAYFDQGSLR